MTASETRAEARGLAGRWPWSLAPWEKSRLWTLVSEWMANEKRHGRIESDLGEWLGRDIDDAHTIAREAMEATNGLDVRTHELKTHPLPFAQVWAGHKTAELRHDDRDFRLGDKLCLREWEPATGVYGRSIMVRITCVTRGWGLRSDMCMLSLGPRTGYENGELIFEDKRGGYLPCEWPDLREPREAAQP